jgi:hypothetical protein
MTKPKKSFIQRAKEKKGTKLSLSVSETRILKKLEMDQMPGSWRVLATELFGHHKGWLFYLRLQADSTRLYFDVSFQFMPSSALEGGSGSSGEESVPPRLLE